MNVTKFEGLPKRFAEAGLKLKLLDKPFERLSSAAGVVQMDIRREFKKGSPFRGEHFVIYPGAPDNVLQVRAVDVKLGQVILMVKEEARSFEEEVPSATVKRYQKLHKSQWLSRLLHDTHLTDKDLAFHKGDVVRVRRQVMNSSPRHFLMGVDERQLFMCQLPRAATSVAEAHASLKAPTVRFAEGKAPGRTIRQGEWFFCNITDEERRAVEEGIAKCKVAVRKRVPIPGNGGKPHVADELISLPGRLLPHGFAVRETEVYIRGNVRHADHETVKLGEWRKVILNTERRENQRMFGGWMD